MELIKRIQAPTPHFFVKLRYLAFGISLVVTSLLNTLTLPNWLTTTLTILASISSGIWGTSFLPKSENNTYKNSPLSMGDVTE